MRLALLCLFIPCLLYSQNNDSISYRISYDTLSISSQPLTSHFELRKNSVVVSQKSRELAATFDDPSRVLLRQVGITTGNDQANGIIFRGLPSDLLKWSIHGAEIVNPNHLSNAGTLSDLASESAGGVLAIPFDVINHFSFHTNPYSINKPNSTAGVADFDFNARGKSFFKLGLLGLETAVQSKGKINVKAHLRYSTVGLLSQLGVNLGDEKIQFADAFLQLNFPNNWSVFGMYGKSSNVHEALDDTSLSTNIKNFQNIDYQSDIAATGLVYEGKRLENSLVYSFKNDQRNCSTAMGQMNLDTNCIAQQFSKIFKISNATNFKVLEIKNVKLDLQSHMKIEGNDIDNQFIDASENHVLFKLGPQVSWVLKSTVVNVNAGYTMTDTNLFPNFAFSYTRSLFGGMIAISRGTIHQFSQASINYNTINWQNSQQLSSFRSINNQISWRKEWNEKYRLLTRIFRYKLFGLPINDELNYSPILNGLSVIPNDSTLFRNVGRARNTGVEMILDANLKKGIYANLNFTVFDLKQTFDQGGSYVNTANNFGYIFNSTISKSLDFKNENRLNINLAFQYRGGGNDFFLLNEPLKLKAYSRVDLRVQYEFKKSILSLDIQNVLNRKNEAGRYYDAFLEDIIVRQQLGLIPVLSWKRFLEK